MAHQVVGGLHGGDGDAGDQILVPARLGYRLPDDLHGLQDAAQGGGVGGEHDGVARLDGDLRLIQRGGRGVGGRDQARDHPHGHGDGVDAPGGIAADLADGFHVLDMLVHAAAGKDIFDDLVIHDAEPGVLVGHLGQAAGVAHAGVGNGPDDAVHLGLAHLGQLPLGGLGGLHQLADLLHGQ